MKVLESSQKEIVATPEDGAPEGPKESVGGESGDGSVFVFFQSWADLRCTTALDYENLGRWVAKITAKKRAGTL